jgi:hypothetical protein
MPTTPPRSATFGRVVLPFALIPPTMVVFAMRDHPAVYRLDPLSANWEWLALLLFCAELASVSIIAGMLRLTAPAGAARASPACAYLLAARVATPLWASAVVLAVPSLAAFIAAHLLAHFAALRTLYRGIRELPAGVGDLEALHLTYMIYSVPSVLWIPLFVMIFVSVTQV